MIGEIESITESPSCFSGHQTYFFPNQYVNVILFVAESVAASCAEPTPLGAVPYSPIRNHIPASGCSHPFGASRTNTFTASEAFRQWALLAKAHAASGPAMPLAHTNGLGMPNLHWRAKQSITRRHGFQSLQYSHPQLTSGEAVRLGLSDLMSDPGTAFRALARIPLFPATNEVSLPKFGKAVTLPQHGISRNWNISSKSWRRCRSQANAMTVGK